jgi:hypothetical protein
MALATKADWEKSFGRGTIERDCSIAGDATDDLALSTTMRHNQRRTPSSSRAFVAPDRRNAVRHVSATSWSTSVCPSSADASRRSRPSHAFTMPRKAVSSPVAAAWSDWLSGARDRSAGELRLMVRFDARQVEAEVTDPVRTPKRCA